MNPLLRMADIFCTVNGEILEFSFRFQKHLPHYKFISRPIYKSCVNRVGEIWATAFSFLSTTTIMHHILPVSFNCLMGYTQSNNTKNFIEFYMHSEDVCAIHWDASNISLWIGFATLVMYIKHKRLAGKELYLNLAENEFPACFT